MIFKPNYLHVGSLSQRAAAAFPDSTLESYPVSSVPPPLAGCRCTDHPPNCTQLKVLDDVTFVPHDTKNLKKILIKYRDNGNNLKITQLSPVVKIMLNHSRSTHYQPW